MIDTDLVLKKLALDPAAVEEIARHHLADLLTFVEAVRAKLESVSPNQDVEVRLPCSDE